MAAEFVSLEESLKARFLEAKHFAFVNKRLLFISRALGLSVFIQNAPIFISLILTMSGFEI